MTAELSKLSSTQVHPIVVACGQIWTREDWSSPVQFILYFNDIYTLKHVDLAQ
jgi:hypothetical protein